MTMFNSAHDRCDSVHEAVQSTTYGEIHTFPGSLSRILSRLERVDRTDNDIEYVIPWTTSGDYVGGIAEASNRSFILSEYGEGSDYCAIPGVDESSVGWYGTYGASFNLSEFRRAMRGKTKAEIRDHIIDVSQMIETFLAGADYPVFCDDTCSNLQHEREQEYINDELERDMWYALEEHIEENELCDTFHIISDSQVERLFKDWLADRREWGDPLEFSHETGGSVYLHGQEGLKEDFLTFAEEHGWPLIPSPYWDQRTEEFQSAKGFAIRTAYRNREIAKKARA